MVISVGRMDRGGSGLSPSVTDQWSNGAKGNSAGVSAARSRHFSSRVKTAVGHELTRHLVTYLQEEMEKNGWGSTKAQGPEGWVPAWGSHAPLLLDPCPIQLLVTGKETMPNQGANEKLLQPPPQCGPWVPTHPTRPGPPLVAAGKKLPLFLPFYNPPVSPTSRFSQEANWQSPGDGGPPSSGEQDARGWEGPQTGQLASSSLLRTCSVSALVPKATQALSHSNLREAP